MRRVTSAFFRTLWIFYLLAAVNGIFFLVSVMTAYAGTTLLAREEILVSVNDDAEAVAKAVVTKAIESAKKHPCSIAAERDKRMLDIGIRLSIIPGEDDTYLTAIVEIVAKNCE